jgi:4-amino-4-deoxy-L-arabinose transferase-like glycosyltransferase
MAGSPPALQSSTPWLRDRIFPIVARWHTWILLGAVTSVSLLMNLWGLSANGYGNYYYAAAVKSMSQSWHNFFFLSFDPEGFISVDKPPVFLWIDTASVWLFGFSSWALLLPSAIAGVASVVLVWYVTKRYFGAMAATMAGLVLALTPIVVVTSRLNQPEPFYVLALIGAAVCLLRSLEGNRWLAWIVAAGVLVGVAFNTKMLVAWIPGPAFVAAIVLGVEGPWREAWRRWLPRVAVLGIATLVVSVSWMVVVDSWPADQRPYIGGSTDNSVRDLIFGYNGFERLEQKGNTVAPAPVSGAALTGNAPLGDGTPGIARLLEEPAGRQVAWLLPLALIGGLASLWQWRDQRLLRAFVVLWLGWLVSFCIVFSFSQGTFHSYYTSVLGPGMAILAGAGFIAFAQLAGVHRAWLLPALVAIALTALVQVVVSGRADGFFEWLRPLMLLVVALGLGLCALSMRQPRIAVLPGLVVVALGFLLIPGVWSGYEAAHAVADPARPKAGPRPSNSEEFFTGRATETETAALAAFLAAQADGNLRWLLVVDDAKDAAILSVDYGLSVLPLGGYTGNDPTIMLDEFAELVASGQIRFAFPSTGFGVPGTQIQAAGTPPTRVDLLFAAVRTACVPVSGFIAPIQTNHVDLLYDCAGKAEQLRAP